MSLSNFSAQSMVSITNAWIDPNKERSLFEGNPLLASILPKVESAHTDLIEIQVKSSTIADTLKKLTQEAMVLDQRHDKKLRGIHMTLTAFAELADDGDRAAELVELRDLLFPNGLSGTQQSFLDEAGEVDLTEGRITDEIRGHLATLPVPGGTLADETAAWARAGRNLGDVERRRTQLAADKDEASISLADVSKARGRWIRVVQTVIQLMELASDISEEDQNRILQPLRTVEEKLDRQRRKKLETEDPDESDIDAALQESEAEVEGQEETGEIAASNSGV